MAVLWEAYEKEQKKKKKKKKKQKKSGRESEKEPNTCSESERERTGEGESKTNSRAKRHRRLHLRRCAAIDLLRRGRGVREKAASRVRARLFLAATSTWLDAIVTTAIVADVLIMCCAYYGMPQALAAAIRWSGFALTVLFVVEASLKLAGLGCREYWSNPWNIFDFTVTVVSVIEAAALLTLVTLRPTLDYSDRSTAESILRVLGFVRTLRVVRVSNNWKAARRLGSAAGRALVRVWPFLALLLVLLVSFALLGLQLWGVTYPLSAAANANGGKKKKSGSDGGVLAAGDGGGADADDGALLFSNAWYAFISAFQVLTGENWNSILYTFMGDGSDLGQEAVAVVYFVTLQFCGFILVLPFFLAAFISELGMGAEAWRRRAKVGERQRRRLRLRAQRKREKERRRRRKAKEGNIDKKKKHKKEEERSGSFGSWKANERKMELSADGVGAEIGAASSDRSSATTARSTRSSSENTNGSDSATSDDDDDDNDNDNDNDASSSNQSSLADIAEEEALVDAQSAETRGTQTKRTSSRSNHTSFLVLNLRLRLRGSRFFSDGGLLDLLALVAIVLSCALLLVDPATVPPEAVRACEITNLSLVCFFTIEAVAKVFAFGVWDAPGGAPFQRDARTPLPYFRDGWSELSSPQ